MDLEPNSEESPMEAALPGFSGDADEDNEQHDDGAGEISKQSFRQGGERRSARQLWLISYSDFMTILMIFFLAMYGYTYLTKMALMKQQAKLMNYGEFTEHMERIHQKLGDQVKVQADVDKVVLQLAEKILFQSGSAALSAEAEPTLEELANSIKLVTGDVVIEGHTDNVPVRGGRFKSNWELSSARAFAVIKMLTEKGVAPDRLAAWGFGENRPLVENTTPEKRALNRRIEVVLLKKKIKQEDSHVR